MTRDISTGELLFCMTISKKRVRIVKNFRIVIVYVAVLLFCQAEFFWAQDSKENSFSALKFPEQAKQLPCPERKTTNFTGRLTAQSVLSESVPSFISEKGIELTYKMARGEYDSVIEEAQESIKENFPWWEGKPWKDGGERDHLKIVEMQRLMANAYELKGDWENAFRAYQMFLGELSEDYDWIFLRQLFIEDQNFFMHCLLYDKLGKLYSEEGEDVRRLVETVRKDEEELEKRVFQKPGSKPARYFRVPYDLRPTWRRVWTFRDRCVRALCPEIYYVTSLTPQDGVACFSDLQKETFERLIDIANDYHEQTKKVAGFGSNFLQQEHEWLEFLRLLDSIPYDLAPNGRYFELQSEMIGIGHGGQYRRTSVQPFIFEER